MSATPGPNNTIAFSTGLNYGFARTWPYTLGVSTGLPLMMIAVAFGLGQFLHTFPQFYLYIRYAGVAYILYLSWKIATAAPPEPPVKDDEASKPETGRDRCPTFLNGVLFQWMNPKAWIAVVTGVSVYVGQDLLSTKMAFMCGMFAVSCLISVAGWSFAGALSGQFIRSPRVYRLLNAVMGLLLASSVLTLF